MTKQEQFFHENAGFSYGPDETPDQGRARCAVAYAAAETWACQEGLYYEICPDWECDESWMDGEPQAYRDEWRGKAWQVILYSSDGMTVLASLGGCYGGKTYERVVKAELALEAMPSSVRGELVVGGAA